MADLPRLQQPYANIDIPSFGNPNPNESGQIVPKGPKASKVSQAQLALQGLIGAK